MTVLIFLAVIFSFSLYSAAKFHKRFELTLPVWCMASGAIIFFAGLAGALKAGAYAVLFIALIFWLLGLLEIYNNKNNLNLFINNFFTPGFAVFLIFAFISALALNGVMVHSWDEFSHWADIVKVLSTLDMLGSPATNSSFASYPPAMAVFQYLIQKIFLLFNPEKIFAEWLIFYAYQIYLFAVLMPLFYKCEFKKFFDVIFLAAIIFITPAFFYIHLYCAVYIDPFLGCLAGSGMAVIILFNKDDKDYFYDYFITLVIFTLVLTKDVGLLLAGSLVLLYIIDLWLMERGIFRSALAVIALALPKLLWNYRIISNGIRKAFDTHPDWTMLYNVISNHDTSYKRTIFENYFNALLFKPVILSENPPLRIHVSYFAIFILMSGLILIAVLFLLRKNKLSKGQAALYFTVPFLQTFIFMFGLCAVYIFNFSEYEGVKLASFDRYLRIAFLAFYIALFALAWKCAEIINLKLKNIFKAIIILPCIAVFLIYFIPHINKEYTSSVIVRAKYNNIVNKINEECEGKGRIYFISQEDSGFDYWVTRFSVRPNIINNGYNEFSWSIGEPFYNGDIWTSRTSAEDLKNILLNNYDYVALHHVNKYFIEHYSNLFVQPETISDDVLYKVNKQTGLLEFIN